MRCKSTEPAAECLLYPNLRIFGEIVCGILNHLRLILFC